MYLQIISGIEARLEAHLYINEQLSHKLRHVLALLLFRGALLAIDLENEAEVDFFPKLFELRKYCHETRLT